MKQVLLVAALVLAVVTVTRSTLPRGIRNKNPGNIRRNDIQWQGMQQIQNDPEFVQFTQPKYGFRAMARILRNYQRRGLTSVRQIISTYAPKNENDTQAYVNFIAKRLNVLPDQPLDVELKMAELLKAIATFENGLRFVNIYSNETINEGIQLA